ncbi:MAG: zinc ribbon domain-containing protein, partial [Oscillospiraceae bacterium]|nr:zinc ribbon domain-containing protein [Oscillospiraceae bacterium]
VISLLIVSCVLLICMTLRYNINSPAITTALAKVILQEIRFPQADGSEKSISEYMFDELRDNISEQNIEILNDRLLEYSGKLVNQKMLSAIPGKKGVLLRVAVSVWIEILLGILMILLLAWMIQIRIRSGKSAGTALKIYSITTVIPCIILFLSGLLLSWIFKCIHLPSELGIILRGGTLLFSGTGILLCVILFCSGMVWNTIHRKNFPAQMPASESVPDMPAPEITKREFCRFCGKKLINPDAQFCYQCGSRQF